MGNEFAKDLARRLQFEEAYNLTPLQLKEWIERNTHDSYLALHLWQRFVSPLQREIAALRFNPEQATPFEHPNKDGGPS